MCSCLHVCLHILIGTHMEPLSINISYKNQTTGTYASG